MLCPSLLFVGGVRKKGNSSSLPAVKECFPPCFWILKKGGLSSVPWGNYVFFFTSKPALRGCDGHGWSLHGKQSSNIFPPASHECLVLSFSPGLARLYENHSSERNFNYRVFSPVTASPMSGLQPCTAHLEEHRRRLFTKYLTPRGVWKNCESSWWLFSCNISAWLADSNVKGGTLTVLYIWKFSGK